MSDLLTILLQFLARWTGIRRPEVPPPPLPPIPTPTPVPIPVPVPVQPPDVVDAINAARASTGLDALTPDPKLDRMAEAWARSMASGDRLDHGDFIGRVAAVYPNTAAGEDIAEGQPTALAVVAAWMQSPPHRANILGAFDRVGAGSAADDSGALYWCADFDNVT